MFLLSFPLGKGDPLRFRVQRREVMCDYMLSRATLCSLELVNNTGCVNAVTWHGLLRMMPTTLKEDLSFNCLPVATAYVRFNEGMVYHST